MTKAFVSRQFLKFLLTGGTAAAVNFGTRIVLSFWLGFSSSVLLAYLAGMITAFILARIFVFQTSRQALHLSLMYFTLVNIMALAQTWAISMGLAYYLLPALNINHYASELAHACGVVMPVFSSYIGHKYWSLR